MLIVAANGDYKIVPYAWYVMKVEKIPEQGEGAKKWKVYFKQVGADESTFKEIAADDWKVGAYTQVGDNTSASNLLCDMYIWRNDAIQNIPFDFYATGIWAK